MSLSSADARLRQFLQRQGGVFTTAQALEVGIATTTLQRRCEWGWYRRVAHGVYLDLAVPPSDRSHRFAALLSVFRGKVNLRDVVDELSPLHRTTRSALESEFISLTTAAGIPPTAVNHPVLDGAGRRRFIDAVYLPPGLPIELDSRLAHGSLLDWHDDLRRENDVAIKGWLPFQRFNWFDVTRRGHLVVAQIQRALDVA